MSKLCGLMEGMSACRREYGLSKVLVTGLMLWRKIEMMNHLGKLLILCCISGPAWAQGSADLVLLTETFPPYNYVQDHKVVGLATEQVLRVFDRIGVEIDPAAISVLPWARAYSRALEEPNVVLFSTARSEDRENLFKWACPVGTIREGLVALESRKIVIAGIKDLKPYRIGVVRETIGHQLLRQALPGKKLVTLDTYNSMALMLQAGRIDLFSFDLNQVDYFREQAGLAPGIFEPVYIMKELPMCVAFNKNVDDALVEAFQRELLAITAEQPAKD